MIFYKLLIYLFILFITINGENVSKIMHKASSQKLDEISSIFGDDERKLIFKYLIYSSNKGFNKDLYNYSKGDIPLYYLTIFKYREQLSVKKSYLVTEELYIFNKRFLDTKEIENLFRWAIRKNDRKLIEKILHKSIFNESRNEISSKLLNIVYRNRHKIVSIVKKQSLKKKLGFYFYKKRNKILGDKLIREVYKNSNERLYYLGKYYSFLSNKKGLDYYKMNLKKMGSYKVKSYYDIAKFYRKLNNYKLSVVWYKKLIKKYPNSKYSAKSLWYLGWKAEMKEEYKMAIKYYEALSKIKTSNLYIDGYFRKGLCQYKLGDYLVAVSTWEKINNFRFYYWRAKAYEKVSLPTRAKSLYEKAMKGGILNFYSIRAAQKLNVGFKLYNKQKIDIIENYHIKEIKFLEEFNLTYLIRYVYRKLSKNERYYISSYLYKRGDLENGYKVVKSFYKKYKHRYQNPSIEELELFFPNFFKDSTLHKEKVFIELSIMKQESNFREKVVSPSGAIGLMQIMPKTGSQIAKSLKLKFSTDSLYNGYYNFKIGSKFLYNLLKKYSGDILYTASAYNAGGERVKRWRKILDKFDDDLRLESIEYSETRNYLRAVYRNYYIYNTLYNNRIEDFKVNMD